MANASRARLTITFHKADRPRPHAWWDAVRPTGGHIVGGYMPIGRGVIPHDLAHLVTEAYFGIDDGFWGLLAQGATFRRGTDRRPTRPGRALVAARRAELGAAEELGNAHHGAWREGFPTPVGAAFDLAAAQWRALPDGGVMRVRWPEGLTSSRPASRATPPRSARRGRSAHA
jgi:hypothetical protein